MRLADLLQWGCGTTWPEETPRETGAAAASAAARWPSTAPRNSRRGRGGAGDGHSPTWRPSLSAILENSAPAAAPREGKMSTAEGAAKAKAKAGISRRVLPRSHSDDYRYIDSSSAVQAHSPTAFLF